MSFLSQRFDNLSTSDNKENRIKNSDQKILKPHDENVSPTKLTTAEVIFFRKNAVLFSFNLLYNISLEICASDRY